MTKTLFLIFFIAFKCPSSYGQFKSYYKDDYKNLEKLDDEIKKRTYDVGDTYYVLTFPVLNAVSSFGMQFYKANHNVSNKNCKIIILINNEGGVREKDFFNLLKKLLKVDDAEIKKLIIINDTKLYNYVLDGNQLVRLLYIFRKNVYYDQNQKLHKVTEVILPTKQIDIKEDSAVKLNGIDSFLLKKGDALFKYKKNKLLILGDFKNVLYEIDIVTGIVTQLLDLKKYFQPYDVYNSEIINFDAAKYNLAKKHNSSLVKKNRQTLQLSQVSYQNNEFVGIFSIEVTEKNKTSRTYINDEGILSEWKKDANVLRNYLFFFHWNPETREISNLSHLMNPQNEVIYTNADCGFYFNGINLYTANIKYPASNASQKRIAQYKLNNGLLNFDKFISPITDKGTLLEYNNTKDFFYQFNNKYLYNYSCIGDICELGTPQKISSFFGDGSSPSKQLNYKKYSEAKINEQIDFEVHSVHPILDGEYLLAFYKYKSKFLFEVKNRDLKTVDIIDAATIKGMEKYTNENVMNNILITDNKIYFIDIVNDELTLKSFSINIETK